MPRKSTTAAKTPRRTPRKKSPKKGKTSSLRKTPRSTRKVNYNYGSADSSANDDVYSPRKKAHSRISREEGESSEEEEEYEAVEMESGDNEVASPTKKLRGNLRTLQLNSPSKTPSGSRKLRTRAPIDLTSSENSSPEKRPKRRPQKVAAPAKPKTTKAKAKTPVKKGPSTEPMPPPAIPDVQDVDVEINDISEDDAAAMVAALEGGDDVELDVVEMDDLGRLLETDELRLRGFPPGEMVLLLNNVQDPPILSTASLSSEAAINLLVPGIQDKVDVPLEWTAMSETPTFQCLEVLPCASFLVSVDCVSAKTDLLGSRVTDSLGTGKQTNWKKFWVKLSSEGSSFYVKSGRVAPTDWDYELVETTKICQDGKVQRRLMKQKAVSPGKPEVPFAFVTAHWIGGNKPQPLTRPKRFCHKQSVLRKLVDATKTKPPCEVMNDAVKVARETDILPTRKAIVRLRSAMAVAGADVGVRHGKGKPGSDNWEALHGFVSANKGNGVVMHTGTSWRDFNTAEGRRILLMRDAQEAGVTEAELEGEMPVTPSEGGLEEDPAFRMGGGGDAYQPGSNFRLFLSTRRLMEDLVNLWTKLRSVANTYHMSPIGLLPADQESVEAMRRRQAVLIKDGEGLTIRGAEGTGGEGGEGVLVDEVPREHAEKAEDEEDAEEAGAAARFEKASITSAGKTNVSPLEQLSRQLHASVVPENLICREEELEGIVDFVAEALEARRSSSLYISGVPGTGKTACVHKAVRLLQEDDGVEPFDFVELNGMNLAEPGEFYPRLYALLNPERPGPISVAKALDWLNHVFLDGVRGRRPLVLLVDELDLLCTRRQNVLYQIFEWATKDVARLVVLAVANTLDLPERLLSHRVSSRLGMSRQCFQPYEFDQLCRILLDRLGGCEGAVEPEALELISRKVAAQSGDLRKALHIAREAVSATLAAGEARLGIARVQAVMRTMRESVRIAWLGGVPLHTALFLSGVVAEYSRTGHEELALPALEAQYRDAAAAAEQTALGRMGVVRIVATLVDAGVLLASPSPSVAHRLLRLNMPTEDLTFAIAKATK